MFLGRQFFPHVIYFIGVGLMADERSRIELILENSFDACVLPQESVCDLGFVVAKTFSEYLLLIVALGFYPLFIEYISNGFQSVGDTTRATLKYSVYCGELLIADYTITTNLNFE